MRWSYWNKELGIPKAGLLSLANEGFLWVYLIHSFNASALLSFFAQCLYCLDAEGNSCTIVRIRKTIHAWGVFLLVLL